MSFVRCFRPGPPQVPPHLHFAILPGVEKQTNGCWRSNEMKESKKTTTAPFHRLFFFFFFYLLSAHVSGKGRFLGPPTEIEAPGMESQIMRPASVGCAVYERHKVRQPYVQWCRSTSCYSYQCWCIASTRGQVIPALGLGNFTLARF